jgi:hypothetical protein
MVGDHRISSLPPLHRTSTLLPQHVRKVQDRRDSVSRLGQKPALFSDSISSARHLTCNMIHRRFCIPQPQQVLLRPMYRIALGCSPVSCHGLQQPGIDEGESGEGGNDPIRSRVSGQQSIVGGRGLMASFKMPNRAFQAASIPHFCFSWVSPMPFSERNWICGMNEVAMVRNVERS